MVRLRPPRQIGTVSLRHARRPARTEDPGLRVRTMQHNRLTWVDIAPAGEPEIAYLREHYQFHPLELEDCLSTNQTPKLDQHADYLFLVLQFPVFNHALRVTKPAELHVFVGEDYLVTVHEGTLKPLVAMVADCQRDDRIRATYMGRSSGYLLYQVLRRLIDYCFPIVNKIIENVNRAEDQIFDDSILSNAREISVLRRDIIEFRRIVKPQIGVLAALEAAEVAFMREDLEAYLGDLSDGMNRIWDQLEDLKEVVEGLNDTNNTLSNARMNDILRVLTVISTIMLPLSVVTGIYGMNIAVLPFAETQESFLIMMGILMSLAGTMLVIFRYRRWI